MAKARIGGWHWGNTNFNVRVGRNTNFSVFRYQHVGIGNAKLWCCGPKATQGSNANGFASQWNIGYRVHGGLRCPARESNITFFHALIGLYKLNLQYNLTV